VFHHSLRDQFNLILVGSDQIIAVDIEANVGGGFFVDGNWRSKVSEVENVDFVAVAHR